MTDLRLGDNCLKIGSGATPRGGKDAYLDQGPFSFIRSQNVHNDAFSIDGLAFISEAQADLLKNVEVREGDVLLNITGDSVARACQVDPAVLPARVNQHVAIIRPDPERIDPSFLRYVLVTPRMQGVLLGLASAGATRNALTKAMIEDLRVPNLHIEMQREIGRVLRTLDDKIELNRRINETLEAMAQAIFRDWFIDFGPLRRQLVGETDPVAIMGGLSADPARAAEVAGLFPAALAEDGLPEGWTAGAAGALIEFNPREPLRKGVAAPYSDMSSLPTVGSNADLPIMREFGSGMRFRNGDALLARITPCLENGKAAFVDFLTEKFPVGWGSTEFIVHRARPGTPRALPYLLCRNDDYRSHAIQSMTGTSGRQRAQVDSLEAWPMAIPTGPVLGAFSAFVDAFFDRISANGRENRALAETRDSLLPRLMSGQVRVLPSNTESAVA